MFLPNLINKDNNNNLFLIVKQFSKIKKNNKEETHHLSKDKKQLLVAVKKIMLDLPIPNNKKLKISKYKIQIILEVKTIANIILIHK